MATKDNASFSKESMDTKTMRKPYGTLALVSVSFLLMLGAQGNLESLQSSLHTEEGLGMVTLSIIFISVIIGSFLVAPVIVNMLTPKWAITFGLIGLTVFTCANFYPRWWTMVPGAMVSGICQSTIWVGQGIYMTEIAFVHAEVTGQSNMAALNKFHGIFNCVLSFVGFLFLVPAIVLENGESDTLTESYNETTPLIYFSNITSTRTPTMEIPVNTNEPFKTSITDEDIFGNRSKLYICGTRHCPYLEEHISVIKRPPNYLIYIFLGCVLFLNLLAVLLSLFLPQPDEILNRKITRKTKKINDGMLAKMKFNLMANLELMLDLKLLLFIPSLVYCMIFYGTALGSFTQSFVSCILGVSRVGFFTAILQFSIGLMSILIGQFPKVFRRFPTTLGGMISVIILSIWWLKWEPANQEWLLYLWGLWIGLIMGTILTIQPAITGDIFEDKQAAFAHFNGWRAVGMSLTFAYGNFLCFWQKIYVIIGSAVFAVITYIMLEAWLKWGNEPPEKEYTVVGISDKKIGQNDV